MLYGLKYGYNESLQWLISFLTAFVMDVFVFEPFKLMAVAMLFICLLGRPVKFIDTPTLVNQESDGNFNVFFMILSSLKMINICIQPLKLKG